MYCNFVLIFTQLKSVSANSLEKVGADVFENCNQKFQEGVGYLNHYQGMDIG